MPKTPNAWPDNQYVEQTLFGLISRQVESGNKDAFAFDGLVRYVNRRALAKLTCHYEIFSKISDLPGHIIELGIFKGESLLRFAQLAEIFTPYDRSFDVIGFDNFSGFLDFHSEEDEVA